MPAALVDIDGTLVDSNYQHALAWYRALRRHGVVRPLWEIHRHIGMGGDHMVAELAGNDVERDSDCRAADRAGVPCVALLTGGFSEQELTAAGAVAVHRSLAELVETIAEAPLGGEVRT